MSGAAYLYIVTNAWFVLALGPTPIARGQSWGERMEQVRRHMTLLAHGCVPSRVTSRTASPYRYDPT